MTTADTSIPSDADSATACCKGGSITTREHAARILGVLVGAGMLLGWLVAHTDVLFADGLRYIAQARTIAGGTFLEGMKQAVDHPVYPVLVAAMHAMMGGGGSETWQLAAQLGSVVAALALVVPLYLVARDLFGDRAALPGCLFFYAVPQTGHVFADALSESTCLLFWTWGLWGALRFLRSGRPAWLVLVAVGSGLAYLTRPEGLLLPAALVGTMMLGPWWVVQVVGRRRVALGLAVLVAGPALTVGPFVMLRGGLDTKPSIARLLGTAPRSDRFAVERQRPLDPNETTVRTQVLAARAVVRAVKGVLTWPLVPLAIVGLAVCRAPGASRREWTLLGLIGLASAVALVRLHATGGYCSPRHALVPTLVLFPAAAAGLLGVVDWLLALGPRLERLRPVAVAAGVALLIALSARESLAPVNEGMRGYRDAGRWLAAQQAGGPDARIVDVTGWSQFYGDRPAGYTFQNLSAAAADPSARWVVVREAHLRGPWLYCKQLDTLTADLVPARVFLGQNKGRATRVFVFDREDQAPRLSDAPGPPARR